MRQEQWYRAEAERWTAVSKNSKCVVEQDRRSKGIKYPQRDESRGRREMRRKGTVFCDGLSSSMKSKRTDDVRY